MNIKNFLFMLIGLYSFIMGIFYGSIVSYTYTHDAAPEIIMRCIIIILISWMIVGGLGLLSFKKYSGVLAFTLIITQLTIESLSGFTIGLFFMPVTIILIVSEIGYYLKASGLFDK